MDFISRIPGFLFDHPAATQSYTFLILLVGIWVLERVFGGGSTLAKLRHSSINFLYLLLAMPVQLVLILICIQLAAWTTRHHWGLVYLFPYAEHPLVKYGVMFFALDFLDYIYHSIMHRVPIMWRLHRFHHTDLSVDVSTTVREHPGETFVRNIILMIWVFLCGASVGVLFLRQSVESITNLLQHTHFRLSPRWARLFACVFITPNLHHTHHHNRLPATNSNFGDVFSFWDRLFGTLVDLPREATVFGVETVDGTPIPSPFPAPVLALFSALRPSSWRPLSKVPTPENPLQAEEAARVFA